ncbi:MAG TPA: helix-turn-helix transcriptional regulator [Stellaceae bacterium]|nr:helix-turn-helix transcriptional regulator [Stellaceae bacterium]
MKRERNFSVAARSSGPSRRQTGKRRVNQVDRLVGRRLRDARVMAGVSKGELGAVLGTNAQMVQRFESGTRRLSAVQVAAAVKFLHLPMADLFKEEVAAEVRMQDAGLTPMEIELVMSFRAIIHSDLRERVLRLAKAASTETYRNI